MNKSNFNAGAWIGSTKSTSNAARVNVNISPNSKAINFLTPGWEGEDLLGRDTHKLKALISKLLEDARTQFSSFKASNKSFKQSVYEEFISYANNSSIECAELFHANQFWSHVDNPNSKYRQHIESFIQDYSFRATVIYLLKMRFLIKLTQAMNYQLNESYFYSPTAILTKIFKSSSSTELFCECLQQHEYSWYRPSSCLSLSVSDFTQQVQSSSVAEIMKVCLKMHGDFQNKNDHKKLRSALSTKIFGDLLGRLLIEFPKWSEGEKVEMDYKGIHSDQIKVLNTKFVGQKLFNVSLAHWLSQEKHSSSSWNQILSPEFTGENYNSGKFLKLCHEFQFLTFLIDFAKGHEYSLIGFICQVMRKKYQSSPEDFDGQIPMFTGLENSSPAKYDRVVLGLPDLPKKNPHHSLTTQIVQNVKSLKNDGYILVFSNQNLFVPSQSERVEAILKEVQLKGFFSIEGVKGKGDLPSFVYVFAKQTARSYHDDFSVFKERKEKCHSFRWTGDLSQISKFNSFITELDNFFATRDIDSTSIFQKELPDGNEFQFVQDAIIDGMLVHSSNQDPTKITHPNFFRRLTKTCVTLDTFFQVEHIEKKLHQEDQNFILKQKFYNSFPYVLIVNLSNSQKVDIELIPSSSYPAKLEHYGTAFFQYFGLTPKTTGLSINGLREFFKTQIGQQVISLTLDGGQTKIKAKLRKMLVPKFLGENKPLPESLKGLFFLNEFNATEILALSDNFIAKQKIDLEKKIHNLMDSFPLELLNLLGQLKEKTAKSLQLISSNTPSKKAEEYYFSNPLFIKKLHEITMLPIAPKNDDIYLEVLVNDKNLLLSDIDDAKVKIDNGNDYLAIEKKGKELIRLYGDKKLLQFIKFIISRAGNISTLDILQNLKVPELEQFTRLCESIRELESSLTENLNFFNESIGTLILKRISF